MTLKAVTANRLRQGDVVYLTDKGRWSPHLNESRVSADKAEQEAMLAQAETAVEAREIIGPYLMDVIEVDAILQPLSTRETIRAAGPTVRADFRGPKKSPRAA
jgi:Protein of unknown function (DUF2849)